MRKACKPCVRAKRRCIPQLPACERCIKRQTKCEYDLEPIVRTTDVDSITSPSGIKPTLEIGPGEGIRQKYSLVYTTVGDARDASVQAFSNGHMSFSEAVRPLLATDGQ